MKQNAHEDKILSLCMIKNTCTLIEKGTFFIDQARLFSVIWWKLSRKPDLTAELAAGPRLACTVDEHYTLSVHGTLVLSHTYAAFFFLPFYAFPVSPPELVADLQRTSAAFLFFYFNFILKKK